MSVGGEDRLEDCCGLVVDGDYGFVRGDVVGGGVELVGYGVCYC